MIYRIKYTEILEHTFFVEADTAKEAEAAYNEMVMNKELDFSYGEIIDSSIEIYNTGA